MQSSVWEPKKVLLAPREAVMEVDNKEEQLIFKPEFIPFYPAIQEKYDLTDKETILYGFVRFFTKRESDRKFYFTNEQLAGILNLSEKSRVSRIVQGLSSKGLIEVEKKMRANGGLVRFLSVVKNDNLQIVENDNLENVDIDNYYIYKKNNIKRGATRQKLTFEEKTIEGLKQITPALIEKQMDTHPRVDVRRELEKFENYLYQSQKEYKDYGRAFANWILKAEDFNGRRGGRPRRDALLYG
jgi:hypothetical protein